MSRLGFSSSRCKKALLALFSAGLLVACEDAQSSGGDPKDGPCVGKCDAIGVSGDLSVAVRSASWDGAIAIASVSETADDCQIIAVRPGRVDRSNGGLTFPPAVFSEGIACPEGLGAHAIAAADLPENPYPSDAEGAATPGGDHLAYELSIVAAEDGLLVSRAATVVISGAGTDDAEVVSAQFGDRTAVLAGGDEVAGEEPTITADGGLLVFNDGEGLAFTRRDGGQWTSPAPLTSLFSEANRDMDGLTVAERYPIAARQLRGPDGAFLAPGSVYAGAHPWISQDGTELFHTSTIAGNPDREGERGRHGAVTVIGQATGHGMRHIDGRINPSRDGMTESITISGQQVSAGRSQGAFAPYPDARTLPVATHAPTYPMFGSVLNTETPIASYTEVDFAVFADRDYLLYLPMNENISTAGGDFQIDTGHTPDVSGHFNTASVEAGARFVVEEFGEDPETGFPVQDDNAGARGRAIFFSDSGAVRVPADSTLPVPRWGMSVELHVQRLEEAAGARPLVQWPGVLSVQLNEDGTVTTTVFIGDESNTSTTTAAVPLGSWTHVGMSYDGRRGQMRLYVNGVANGLATFPRGMPGLATGDLLIGPAGGAQTPLEDDVSVLALDEVAISQIVRMPDEMYFAATGQYMPGQNMGGEELLVGREMPTGLDARELQIPAWAPLQDEVVELGQLIFFDTRLSANGQVSCATCHDPEFAFTDGRAVALAIDGTDLPRATPTVFNRALSTRQFWDGRARTVESQALSPIGSPREMGFTIQGAVDLLASSPEYVERFESAFGRGPDRNAIANAIAAFERAQFAGDSPVDRFEAGELDALTEAEQRGRVLFHGRARCDACHDGSNYSDELLHNVGLLDDRDFGAFFTSGARLKNNRAFKTPTLRNIDVTGPYFHNGAVETLEEVVSLYNVGPTQPGADWSIRPLGLTADEEADLVAFLRALTSPNATTPMDVVLPEIPE